MTENSEWLMDGAGVRASADVRLVAAQPLGHAVEVGAEAGENAGLAGRHRGETLRRSVSVRPRALSLSGKGQPTRDKAALRPPVLVVTITRLIQARRSRVSSQGAMLACAGTNASRISLFFFRFLLFALMSLRTVKHGVDLAATTQARSP